ncbi:unannotated protein [freshwater metagenome]|uniref:Unannotated protein n=1 Tax=freshwater metagenome TaxID=449393 RepID=A0A6J7G1N0_9ZZZZ
MEADRNDVVAASARRVDHCTTELCGATYDEESHLLCADRVIAAVNVDHLAGGGREPVGEHGDARTGDGG